MAVFFRGWNSFLKFCRWVLLGLLAGAVVALPAAGFHHLNEFAQALRLSHGWLLYLLPLAGLAIVGLYRLCGVAKDRGTNLCLTAVRENQGMALRVTPLIIVSTVLTHLTGGSAGREGAALQIGSSITSFLGRKLGLQENDARMMVMCGMAAGFAALFGTPLASAVFAIEVVSVGVMQYAALVPCMVSALAAQQIALRLGCHAAAFDVPYIPAVGWRSLGAVLAFGCLCGLLAWFEGMVMEKVHHGLEHYLENPYLRAAAGGCLVVLLTLLLGSRDYNGAGMDVIARAVAGEAVPWAFACKLLFTALTIGAGFKGGEIVPTFFIGATFGCTVGPLLGLPAGFAAALGMAALFCGVTNAPLATVLLAYELFGGAGLPLFVLVCAVSYRLSGCGGLYSAQKIVFSKELPVPYIAEPSGQETAAAGFDAPVGVELGASAEEPAGIPAEAALGVPAGVLAEEPAEAPAEAALGVPAGAPAEESAEDVEPVL